jgi:uncharacterized membrane protein YjgN (DUF898 family)
VKSNKQFKLSWKGGLGIFAGTIVGAWLFDHFGRFDLARPVLVSIIMLGIAVALKWELRRRVWFWITMTVMAGLHFALILWVTWSTAWVPAVVLTPIGLVDLFVILAVLAFVEKRVDAKGVSSLNG